MNHVVMNCPEEGLDKLEEISFLLKNKETYRLQDFLKTNEESLYAKFNEDFAAITKEFNTKANAYFVVGGFKVTFVETCCS